MSLESGLVIEPLNRLHDRAAFNSGNEPLDRYLQRQAGQDIKRRVSRVFICRSRQDKTRVRGYYTLSTLAIDLSELPEKVAKKLPRHSIPAALIGRLAVDLSEQGKGIGRLLLSDAIKRTLAVSDEIAIYAIVVDAITNEAESFYLQYGFVQLASKGKRLYLPLKSL